VDPKSSTILTAVVPASLQTSAGNLVLVVSNPAGDSAASKASTITVGNTASIYNNGVVSAASYASDAVSPGELVSIFGVNIGPTSPAPMSVTNGYVDTSLNGVSVQIDGQAAPLVYISQNELTVQVPYEAALGANKTVAITNGTNSASTTIQDTAPGIFTADGSGTGQAAALNLAAGTGVFTLNSSTTPAKIGDTLILYLTGEGNYNAQPISGTTNTGYIVQSSVNPLPQLNPLPTVSIGGVDASAGVTFAGPIVGSMLGLLEIEVTVPAGSATGAAVPVVVTIGGNSTLTDQPNVTVAIHP
jgi:uncharacterized protein (TIGR03437 family)